jgi:hypothetical protein
VQQVAARTTKGQCFPPAGNHQLLPENLSRFNAWQFPPSSFFSHEKHGINRCFTSLSSSFSW